MYPKNDSTVVTVSDLSQALCGASRPGHFQGVATVVAKLFIIVMPDEAYFGQKDYQQVVVIKKMTTDLNFPISIKTVATVREKNGLALSSRNQYLSPKEHKEAAILFHSLRYAKT